MLGVTLQCNWSFITSFCEKLFFQQYLIMKHFPPKTRDFAGRAHAGSQFVSNNTSESMYDSGFYSMVTRLAPVRMTVYWRACIPLNKGGEHSFFRKLYSVFTLRDTVIQNIAFRKSVITSWKIFSLSSNLIRTFPKTTGMHFATVADEGILLT